MADYSDVAIPLTVGIGAWFTAMPDLREVRNANPDRAYMVEIRHTEFAVIAVTVIVGVIGVAMCKHHAPLSAAILVVAALMGIYEFELRTVHP